MIRFVVTVWAVLILAACAESAIIADDSGVIFDGGRLADAGTALDAGREVNFEVDGGQPLRFWAIDLPETPIPASCFADGSTGTLPAQHFEAALWTNQNGDRFFVLAPHADLSLGDAAPLKFGAWAQTPFVQRQIAHISATANPGVQAISTFIVTIDVPVDGGTGQASLRSRSMPIDAGVDCSLDTTFTLHSIAPPAPFIGTSSVAPGATRYLVALRPEPEPSSDCYLSGVAPMPSSPPREGTWEVWTYDANRSPHLRTPPHRWSLGDVQGFDVPGTYDWRDVDLRWAESEGSRETTGERLHAENITDWVEGAPFQFVSQSWGSLWTCKSGAPCAGATPLQKLECTQNRAAWAARIE